MQHSMFKVHKTIIYLVWFARLDRWTEGGDNRKGPVIIS